MLSRLRPIMDIVQSWKEVFDFLEKLSPTITDAAPLNTAARAILKQCQKLEKKHTKKRGKKTRTMWA